MKLALIQEKQNKLYSFNQPDLRFTKDQIMELQKEMIDQNLKIIYWKHVPNWLNKEKHI